MTVITMIEAIDTASREEDIDNREEDSDGQNKVGVMNFTKQMTNQTELSTTIA